MAEEFSPRGLTREQEEAAQEWGRVTIFGLLGGMLFGGCREAVITSGEEEAVMPSKRPQGAPVRGAYFQRREAMEQRLLQISKGSIRWGAQLGLFSSLFSGLQLASASARGKNDMWNMGIGGAGACGALGLIRPGTIMSRLRTSAGGMLIGGLVCIPIGLLTTSLESLSKSFEESPKVKVPNTSLGGVQGAIQLLERNLGQRVSPDPADEASEKVPPP